MFSLASCHLPQSGKYFMLLHACMILEFFQIYYVFKAFYQLLYFMCTLPICDKFKIYCVLPLPFFQFWLIHLLCPQCYIKIHSHEFLYYDWLSRHSILCTAKLEFAFIVWHKRGKILSISKSVAFIFTDVNYFSLLLWFLPIAKTCWNTAASIDYDFCVGSNKWYMAFLWGK